MNESDMHYRRAERLEKMYGRQVIATLLMGMALAMSVLAHGCW